MTILTSSLAHLTRPTGLFLLASILVYPCWADTVNNEVLAPGYAALNFDAPTPGSYQLPVIAKANDGNVIDSHGNRYTLSDLYQDKIVLLSFIYTTCNDVNGCPLATSVLHQLKNRLQRQSEITEHLRLLTLSFNPAQDTPKVMADYGRHFKSPGIDWRFLTTHSENELKPILNHYQQHLNKNYDDQGDFVGTFSHILRVFLIDKQQRIRNIYSVSFLHADTLINDVKTLLQEQQNLAEKTSNIDSKKHLADAYKTSPSLGLPMLTAPLDNPVTLAKVKLGKKLFFDRRLSSNNTLSCAMCHIPDQGFTNTAMATAVGIEGLTGKRNSPTLYNVGYLQRLFHDGRETTLENQVWGPLLADNEMGNPSIEFVVNKISTLTDYNDLFAQTFNSKVSKAFIGMALASYQRTLNSANSPFDRWYYGQQKQALSKQAQQGFKLFTGKGNCSSCHLINQDYALFTDDKMHNTGFGYQQSMSGKPLTHNITIAPGVTINVESKLITSVSGIEMDDLGLFEVTQNPDDRWKFKTPSLRNIALTRPYMHNGQLNTLEQVIQFYNQGGSPNPGLSPMVKPLHLSDNEIKALLAFLESLTGDNINKLSQHRLVETNHKIENSKK